ncbi:MAG TPA: PA14 domain-containing protein [Planctomycetota bacterium]|nr:PA14 domain-containing protein [Planctomycetota bacterium]
MLRIATVAMGLVLAGALAMAGDANNGNGGNNGNNGNGGQTVKRDAGLVAHYFKDPIEWDGNWKEGAKPTVDAINWTFREYKYSRIEPLVNHSFIRRGWFSVRWVGSIDLAPGNSGQGAGDGKVKGVVVPAEGVEVTFDLLCDDGARMYVDGEKVIDDWRPCAAEADPTAHRIAKVKLTPGPHKIVVEYFQGESLLNDDRDPAKLYWSCDALKIPKQVIPAAHFSHTEEDLKDYEPSIKPADAKTEKVDVNLITGPEKDKGGKK